MAKVEKITKVVISDARIISVEPGSIKSNIDNPVVAFSCDANDEKFKRIKCILKGDQAKIFWHYFLKEGGSIDKSLLVDGNEECSIDKKVRLSFSADIREERTKELVLQNPSNITFSYIYSL